MFIDIVELVVSSGKGGAGAVSFRREKFIINGGPDGGDGGDGGDVYIETDANADTLSRFRGIKKLSAKNGRPGEGKKKSGKKGEDLILKLPLGTQIIDVESGELLLDIIKPGKFLFLNGGKGGAGNFRFRNAVNQQPTYAQPGLPGVLKKIRLELKIIADVGLVGFPNVGKSTLLSVLSNAKPQIADYEFTTLIPQLGVIEAENESFVMADIPGIINGASIGKGLGLEFLRHIERTKIFLFMLDSNKSPLAQFRALLNEVTSFRADLKDRRFAIALTKSDISENLNNEFREILEFFDIKSDELVWENKENLAHLPMFVISISSATNDNIARLKNLLFSYLRSSDVKEVK